MIRLLIANVGVASSTKHSFPAKLVSCPSGTSYFPWGAIKSGYDVIVIRLFENQCKKHFNSCDHTETGEDILGIDTSFPVPEEKNQNKYYHLPTSAFKQDDSSSAK